ncbi:chemotaxis protein MotB [Frigidibacter albus]|uniref:Chemotaxis protein MotB n=1 Tax=Frigidibacter albus TaxID=1465486 RepID=A0A6L8VH96_9RHOB|nr:flagellar motor protein MotB [Frigidibacter albus]MZQ89675.1 chemotaxis protein MotB [Frigidibacter albus]NBE31581.1 chemotaxis protein MotB [Frigidibacter albus]
MGAVKNAAPVIIKRKKVVVGGGHHGGAWKVAYADFVTAMMAFFLLMWLLNATTEKQRKGIADYFNPTIPINRISGGGEGAFGGDSVFSEEEIAQNGTGASGFKPTEERQAVGRTGTTVQDERAAEAEARDMARMESMLKGFGGESMVTENLARHIVTRLTDEGLIVEFFDLEDAPLFAEGTADPMPVTRELAGMISRVFGLVDNEVAAQGHISAPPEVLRKDPSWDLSTARAQALRILIEEAGFEPRRVQRVTGFADRIPAVRNPMAVRNNRVEVILLRSNRV